MLRLSEEEVSAAYRRAREIADLASRSSDAELDNYLKVGEELGIPREALAQALREQWPVPDVQVGARVFAPSADNCWYPAEILAVEPHSVEVRFLRGGTRSCAPGDLRALDLVPGRKVQAPVKGWGWYRCRVQSYDAKSGKVKVVHDDWTEQEDRFTLDQLRLNEETANPETAAAKPRPPNLFRIWLFGTAVGILAGALLHHLYPFLFPFLR